MTKRRTKLAPAALGRFVLATAIAGGMIVGGTIGCKQTLDVENQEGRVTSIGPVFVAADGRHTIRFTVYDSDSDSVDVNAEYSLDSGSTWTALPDCTSSLGEPCEVVGGLARLSTDQDIDVQYEIGWLAPANVIGVPLQLRMYVSNDTSRGVVSELTL